MLYEDLFTVLVKVRKDLPLFIIGHSVGGGVITTILLKNPDLKIAGVILHNPFIKVESGESMKITFKDKMNTRMAPKFFENFLVDNKIYPHIVVKGEKALKKIFDDRLLLPVTTIKMFRTMMRIERSLFS